MSKQTYIFDYGNFERALNKYDPRIMELLYPRIYDNVGGFGSPKKAAIDLATMLAFTRKRSPYYKEPDAAKPPTTILAGPLVAEALIPFRVPTFFIAKDFFGAAMNSSPPLDFPVTELRFPFPAMIFMLPNGAFTSPTDGPIDFLAFAAWRGSGGREMLSNTAFPDGTRVRIKGDCLSWFTRARGTGVDFAAITGELGGGTLGDFFSTADTNPPSSSGSAYEMPVDADDDAFIKSVPRVILKLLLAMTARPELIEHGTERKPAKVAPNGERVHPAFWTPNIIGRKYRLTTEVGERLEEKHHSPRMHWRRGHYRLQPFGEGRLQSRLIWINPMLIAAE